MKQVIQTVRGGAIRVIEVPQPILRPAGILVRTTTSLVSAGTERNVAEFARKNLLAKARARPDLVRKTLDKARREGALRAFATARARLDRPLTPGYSLSGVVIAVGAEASRFRIGDRVACGGANYAVHAETVYVPQHLAVPLPDGVSDEAGAFVTVGAIALQGIRVASDAVTLGARVAVIGLGLIGQLIVQMLRAAGTHVFAIDLKAERVALARTMGAQGGAINADVIRAAQRFTAGYGFDAVLIAADTRSSEPLTLAGTIARDRAVIVAIGVVGMTIPRPIYYGKELDFRLSRSYGPGRYDPQYEGAGHDYPIGYVRWTEGRNMDAVVDLLASGALKVSPLITHHFAIDEAPRAYELISGKTGESSMGVVLGYDDLTPRPPLREHGEGESDQPFHFAESESDQPGLSRRVDAARNPQRPLSMNTETGLGSEVRLGVLGAGNFAAATLLPAIRSVPNINRRVIASASGWSARHAADRFGFTRVTGGLDEILADPAINWLAILTPHHQHAAQAIAAMEAGKDVFVEKPLAITPESLEAVLAVQHTTGRRLMVGFNRRFAPMVVQMRDFMGAKPDSPLIAMCRVNAGEVPPDHWTQDLTLGGGRIIGEACHFVDLLTFLLKALPIRAYTVALPSHLASPDDVIITLNFANGSVGTIIYTSGGASRTGKERIEMMGDGKSAILDDYRRLELFGAGRRTVQREWMRPDKGHHAEWVALAAAVASGAPSPIDIASIAAVHRATFAILESLRRGEPIAIG